MRLFLSSQPKLSTSNSKNEVTMSKPITLNMDNTSKSKKWSPINATSQNIIKNLNFLYLKDTYNNNTSNDTNLLCFSNTYSDPLFIINNSIDKKLHSVKLHLIQIGKLLHKLVNDNRNKTFRNKSKNPLTRSYCQLVAHVKKIIEFKFTCFNSGHSYF